jgi:hypothetical protein
MAGSVIRDPRELRRFADELTDYVENMKALSIDLENDISDAQGQMRDEVSRIAFASIGNFRDAIVNEMPYCVDLIEKFRKSAAHLESAANSWGVN